MVQNTDEKILILKQLISLNMKPNLHFYRCFPWPDLCLTRVIGSLNKRKKTKIVNYRSFQIGKGRVREQPSKAVAGGYKVYFIPKLDSAYNSRSNFQDSHY